jgi:S-DNA-T family DNA segregation ATPase FtsK/SpoIIIE
MKINLWNALIWYLFKKDRPYHGDLTEFPTYGALPDAASKLPVLLGTGEDGAPVKSDLSVLGSILMAGTTGSGKSLFGHNVINSLMGIFPPYYVKFLLVDVKRIEFFVYKGLPYLLEEPILDLNKALDSLEGLADATLESKFTVVLIDTFSELAILGLPRFENIIKKLTERTGTYVIMWDSRPSEVIYTEIIKRCFPTKIIFNTATKEQSVLVCGSNIGFDLKGRGDAVVFCKELGGPTHVQLPYISYEEIAEHVKFRLIKDSA